MACISSENEQGISGNGIKRDISEGISVAAYLPRERVAARCSKASK